MARESGGTAAHPITWVFEPESFAPAARLAGGEQHAIITDHLGTPTAMLDGAGQRVWSADIGIYGELRNVIGEKAACPFRWPGQYEDEETGLYYNRFRYYDPESGEYVSQDPSGIENGFALHAYPSDPLFLVDLFGLTTGAGRDHVTYRGLRDGKPYTGYASAPSSLGLRPKDIVARRYGGDFSRFGGQPPRVVYSGSGVSGKETARGLEQHYFESDVKRHGRANVANAQNPVGPLNKKRAKYRRAAKRHLKGCK